MGDFFRRLPNLYTILFYYFLIVSVIIVIVELFGRKNPANGSRHPIAGMMTSIVQALICAAFKSYYYVYNPTYLYIACGFMVLAGICTLIMVFRADGKWTYVGTSIMCTVTGIILWNLGVGG